MGHNIKRLDRKWWPIHRTPTGWTFRNLSTSLSQAGTRGQGRNGRLEFWVKGKRHFSVIPIQPMCAQQVHIHQPPRTDLYWPAEKNECHAVWNERQDRHPRCHLPCKSPRRLYFNQTQTFLIHLLPIFFSTIDGKHFTNRLVSSDMQEKRAQLPYVKATYVGISNFWLNAKKSASTFLTQCRDELGNKHLNRT